jgi:hypothetical protein
LSVCATLKPQQPSGYPLIRARQADCSSPSPSWHSQIPCPSTSQALTPPPGFPTALRLFTTRRRRTGTSGSGQPKAQNYSAITADDSHLIEESHRKAIEVTHFVRVRRGFLRKSELVLGAGRRQSRLRSDTISSDAIQLAPGTDTELVPSVKYHPEQTPFVPSVKFHRAPPSSDRVGIGRPRGVNDQPEPLSTIRRNTCKPSAGAA